MKKKTRILILIFINLSYIFEIKEDYSNLKECLVQAEYLNSKMLGRKYSEINETILIRQEYFNIRYQSHLKELEDMNLLFKSVLGVSIN